ncbi:MAG: flagellar basal-body MS-ring/collar protein FliF [Vicinamibacterales bacterium]
MNAQQILARLGAFTSSFTPAQLASLGGAFVLVVSVVAGSAWWLNRESYALLFADLDPEAASEMVSRLSAQSVPYQLEAGGRGIRVPASRIDELRLQLTAEGMPASGRVGFEIFDRTAFGATEFLEQVNYRRALEGEIARTIATISEVSSARVHIAMGKDTLFGESRPAKASVILKLRGQRMLPEPTVAGISNLVAASVEGLRPESVVILDSFGRPLLRAAGDDDPLGAAQLDRQQRLERDLSQRVVALLEPVVGPGRVRVNAAVRLNPRSSEQTEEIWDPNTVLRSRQTSIDGISAAAAAGIAGARANTPPPAAGTEETGARAAGAGPPSPVTAGTARSAETAAYEVSRTTRHTIQPPGEIARLSLAVILDDDQEFKTDGEGQTTVIRTRRSAEELRQLQALVAAAVGFDASRGDQLTVENVAFDEPPADETAPSVLERYSPQIWEGGRMLLVAGLGLAALLLFVRPLMGRASMAAAGQAVLAAATPLPAGVAAPAIAQGPRTVAEIESEIEAQLDAAAAQRMESRKLPALTRRVSAMSAQNPETVAKLLRTWITDHDR